MVRRTGKGYVLTLVGTPPYEGESGVSTSKGVIFDCEFGGKKGRIVVKCEPENPAKVTKEELDEAIKQAADYLEDKSVELADQELRSSSEIKKSES